MKKVKYAFIVFTPNTAPYFCLHVYQEDSTNESVVYGLGSKSWYSICKVNNTWRLLKEEYVRKEFLLQLTILGNVLDNIQTHEEN
jgi:hypothetical protein